VQDARKLEFSVNGLGFSKVGISEGDCFVASLLAMTKKGRPRNDRKKSFSQWQKCISYYV